MMVKMRVLPEQAVKMKVGTELIEFHEEIDNLITKSTVNFKNDRISEIANNIFCFNHNLVSVDAPNLKVIGTQVFKGCDALTTVNVPKCNIVKDEGFMNATALTNLELPAENVKVGNSSFEGCTRLEELKAPNMESVGLFAFKGCTSLKNVNYPKAKVGTGAFHSCNLDTVVLSGNFGGVESLTEPTGPDDGQRIFYKGTVKSFTLAETTSLNLGSFDGFNGAELVSLEAPNLKDLNGTNLSKWIGNGSSTQFPKLEKVNLPSLTSDNKATGGACFRGYQSLKNANLGECKLSFESFYDCTELRKVFTRSNIIPAACFYNCNKLRRFNIEQDGWFDLDDYSESLGALNIERIEGHAFFNCLGLKVVVLNHNLKYIEQNAFGNCINLKDVVFYGKQEDWNNITIESGNEYLLNARRVIRGR